MKYLLFFSFILLISCKSIKNDNQQKDDLHSIKNQSIEQQQRFVEGVKSS